MKTLYLPAYWRNTRLPGKFIVFLDEKKGVCFGDKAKAVLFVSFVLVLCFFSPGYFEQFIISGSKSVLTFHMSRYINQWGNMMLITSANGQWWLPIVWGSGAGSLPTCQWKETQCYCCTNRVCYKVLSLCPEFLPHIFSINKSLWPHIHLLILPA